MNKIYISLICLISVFYGNAQNDSVYVLDLRECVDIAINNNLTIKRSLLQKEGNEINFRQSRAGRYPSLNVGGNIGSNWGRSIDPTSNQFISQQIGFSGFSGNASVTVFNWFRITNSIKQNSLLLESSEFDVQKVQNDVTLDIVTFYLNVIFNQELLENARFQLESSQEQLERTEKLVAGGALPRTRELELISQVATNEVNMVTSQNNLDIALLNLKQAMLIPSSQQIQIVIPDLELDGNPDLDVTAEEVFAIAVGNMPEIKSAELQMESAAMGVKVAEAGYAPSLTVNGSIRSNYSDAADRARPIYDGVVTQTEQIGTVEATGQSVVTEITRPNQVDVDPDFTVGEQFEQNLSNQVSLSLNIPIFNNLQASSGVQRAKISLQQAEITSLEQKNTLRQSIETAYNDAQSASKTYTASLRQVEALEETFRSVENQYNLGAANFTDYQVAANNLFGARSDLVRAKFDFIFKMKVLDFFQGKPITL